MRALKWLLTAIATGMIVPIVTGFFVDWAKKTDAYAKPEETVGSIWSFTIAFAQNPYFTHAAALVAGIAIGLWADSVLRKADGSRAAKAKSVGYDMTHLGGQVRQHLQRIGGEWPDSIIGLTPDLAALIIDIQKVGIAPLHKGFFEGPSGAPLVQYLLMVGKLLSEGHIKEAKEMARDIVSKTPDPSKQGT